MKRGSKFTDKPTKKVGVMGKHNLSLKRAFPNRSKKINKHRFKE